MTIKFDCNIKFLFASYIFEILIMLISLKIPENKRIFEVAFAQKNNQMLNI